MCFKINWKNWNNWNNWNVKTNTTFPLKGHSHFSIKHVLVALYSRHRGSLRLANSLYRRPIHITKNES